MPTKRERSEPTNAKTAKDLRDLLLKDEAYLAQIDEALEEARQGTDKTLEEIEMMRQQRRLRSGE